MVGCLLVFTACPFDVVRVCGLDLIFVWLWWDDVFDCNCAMLVLFVIFAWTWLGVCFVLDCLLPQVFCVFVCFAWFSLLDCREVYIGCYLVSCC